MEFRDNSFPKGSIKMRGEKDVYRTELAILMAKWL